MNTKKQLVKDDTGDTVTMAEKDYLSDLESFFSDKWGETKLWSHDLYHHQRVWQYAKELLATKEHSPGHLFATKLLIGCYLHDIGMSLATGEKHGIFSRQICEEYLLSQGMYKQEYYDLLEAVEAHDDKNYSETDTGNRLHLILSVADDLDAFGHTGILRYFEIYTRRGIGVTEICPLVLKNAESRYNNFTRHFGSYEDLVKKHSQRYWVLREFF
ncbi:MAG: HD domain-containing protein, partial [Bacteroidales bacterium]|nr:HD domain-containing protein [Bacteroidales bacterium]MBN2633586.1 HD domain-containing protein [Bacteroidales bacterium]